MAEPVHPNERIHSPGWAFFHITGDGNNVTFSPVVVLEVIGALFLGALAITLLISWQRAEKRNRELEELLLERR